MISIDSLQSYAMFGGVNDQQLIVLSRLLQTENYPEGTFLFHQDDPADRLLFIQQGQVEILTRVSDETLVPIAKCQEGDSIGEMAMIDMQRRSASVRALEPVTALSLSYGSLCELYTTDPQLYTLMLMNLARELSRRLRAMDKVVASALFSCPAVGDSSEGD